MTRGKKTGTGKGRKKRNGRKGKPSSKQRNMGEREKTTRKKLFPEKNNKKGKAGKRFRGQKAPFRDSMVA